MEQHFVMVEGRCIVPMCDETDTVCLTHNEHEPDEGYRPCGECFHVFKTAEELVTEYNKDRPEGVPPQTDPDKIFHCPLCAHDF